MSISEIDPAALRKYCPDCIREKRVPPRTRASRNTYCTHHTYRRTLASRIRADIRNQILPEGRFEDLGQTMGNGKPRYPEDVVSGLADKYWAQALTALRYLADLISPTTEQAAEASKQARYLMQVSTALRLKRRLTPEDLATLRKLEGNLLAAMQKGEDTTVQVQEQPKTEPTLVPKKETVVALPAEPKVAPTKPTAGGKCFCGRGCAADTGCRYVPPADMNPRPDKWGPAE